jgi:dTDP-4-amino-4,6-dideoxygalactose transaminase
MSRYPKKLEVIPLVRPVFPPFNVIHSHFKKSKAANTLSNFGPCFDQVVGRLQQFLFSCHPLPVATGTAAIQIAVQTHFRRGSKIAIPDYTHIGTLQAVTAAGCEPVLFPCDRETWTIDLKVLNEHIREMDGVIVVSPFGYQVDFARYDELTRSAKRILIYDLAGGWGMQPATENTVCYSLHATKNFSCGEGGIVCFNKRPDFMEGKRLINFDILPDRSVASPWGTNLKLDELKLAVILAHLDDAEKLTFRTLQKKATLDVYHRELESVCIPHELHRNGAPSLCVLGGMKAMELESACKVEGFICKQYYPLLSQMPLLNDIPYIEKSSPFFQTCLALPSDVSFDEAIEVSIRVKRILKR